MLKSTVHKQRFYPLKIVLLTFYIKVSGELCSLGNKWKATTKTSKFLKAVVLILPVVASESFASLF